MGITAKKIGSLFIHAVGCEGQKILLCETEMNKEGNVMLPSLNVFVCINRREKGVVNDDHLYDAQLCSDTWLDRPVGAVPFQMFLNWVYILPRPH